MAKEAVEEPGLEPRGGTVRAWRARLAPHVPVIRFVAAYALVALLLYAALHAWQAGLLSMLETHLAPLLRKALDLAVRGLRAAGLTGATADTAQAFPLRALAAFVAAVLAVRVPIGEKLRGLLFGVVVILVAHLAGALLLPAAASLPAPFAAARRGMWEGALLGVMALAWLRWYTQLDPLAQR
jgi:hypothetical protein